MFRAIIFGNSIRREQLPFIKSLFLKMEKCGAEPVLHHFFYQLLSIHYPEAARYRIFDEHKDIHSEADFLFSVGGDGTFLQTLPLVRESGIPVLGFNTGRLGFLASISREEASDAIDDIVHKNFYIQKRNILHTQSSCLGDDVYPYALNEVSVHKKDSASMINVIVHVNNQYLNTYWADGLIVATPTGSTAYSLSCGGPIMAPDSESIVITPVSTHNLTVRPIVIPDSSIVKIRVEGRKKTHLLNLDSRSANSRVNEDVTISKGGFDFRVIQFERKTFFSTLREKLMWGTDKRN
jgi:NAD+ kinase